MLGKPRILSLFPTRSINSIKHEHSCKILYLMSKLGKIIDIKYNYGSKIYPENQVILDCFMPSTSVKVTF